MSEYDHCLITFLRGHNGSTETFINNTATQKGLNPDQSNWTSEKIKRPHRSDTNSLETYSCSLLGIGLPLNSVDKNELRLLHSVYKSSLLGINQQLLGNFLIVWPQPMGKYYTNVSQLASATMLSHWSNSQRSTVHQSTTRKNKCRTLPLYIILIKYFIYVVQSFLIKIAVTPSCLTGYIQYETSYCERVWVVFSRFH